MPPRATAFPPLPLSRAVATVCFAVLSAGCAQTGSLDADRFASNERQRTETSPVTTLATTGREFDPKDTRAAVRYAQSLKATGEKGAALLVLQQASMHAADDRELASEYGRLALELDQLPVAERMLQIADDPMRPDWRVLSARGTLLARQAKYMEAVSYFERALAQSPGNATVLNNLAMALAAKGEAGRAELLLTEAGRARPADPRIRANLKLVAELQGKKSDPVAAAALPAVAMASPPAPAPAPVPAAQPVAVASIAPPPRPSAPVATAWTTGIAAAPPPPPPLQVASTAPLSPVAAPVPAPVQGWTTATAVSPTVPPMPRPPVQPAVAGWSMSTVTAAQTVVDPDEFPATASIPQPAVEDLPSPYWRPTRR